MTQRQRLLGLMLVAWFPLGWALDPGNLVTQYIYDHWDGADGIPQVSVQALTQTSDGFLWIGTQSGAVRFDGHSMELFNKRFFPEFKNDFILCFFEDRQKNLWFGTRKGVVRLRDNKFDLLPGSPETNINAICQLENGNIWLATGDGLYSLFNGTFQLLAGDDGFRIGKVRTLLPDRDGSVWVGTHNGLARYEDGHWSWPLNQKTQKKILAQALCQGQDGSIWIGTKQGLYRYSGKNLALFTKKDGMSSNHVSALAEDPDGILWVGTDQGLDRFRSGSFLAKRPSSDSSLSKDIFDPTIKMEVLCLLPGREGELWFGTHVLGLHRLRDGPITSFGSAEGLADMTRAVIQDHKGALWVGSSQGLYHMDDQTITRFGQENGLSSDRIQCLLEDSQKAIWIGTRNGGLNRMSRGTIQSFSNEQGFLGISVRALLEDREGHLWIGTLENGLALYRNGHFQHFFEKDGLSSDSIYALAEDRQGRIWVGTSDKGLTLFNQGKFEKLPSGSQLADDTIYSFYQDSNNDIWIGMDGGLARCRNESLAILRAGPYAPVFPDKIYQILEDDTGTFWFSSIQGLYSIPKTDVNRFLDQGGETLKCRTFGIKDGMRAAECNFGGSSSGVKTDSGEIWFPTARGIVRAQPLQQTQPLPPPPVWITTVEADSLFFPTSMVREFEPGLDKIHINFTAPSFSTPERVRFRTQLVGYEKSESESTRRGASYTNLPPGDFEFRVKASNGDGVWSETGASFRFKIKKPFYQTFWFYAFVFIFVLLFCMTVIRMRVRSLVRREHELKMLVGERTQALVAANKELLKTQEQLVQAAHQAGMAEIAANVLHNIGNALNSINVTACLIEEGIQDLRIDFFKRVVDLINKEQNKINEAVNFQQGTYILAALNKVSRSLIGGRSKLKREVHALEDQVSRINDIVRAQQAQISSVGNFYETVDINKIINDTLEILRHNEASEDVKIIKHFSNLPPVRLQKSRLAQILFHLLNNAFDSVSSPESTNEPEISVRTDIKDHQMVCIEFTDNGKGIKPSQLKEIFFHGFTTKPHSDGFGLHYCANTIKEMHGTIVARSAGLGFGATFELTFPIKCVSPSERDENSDACALST